MFIRWQSRKHTERCSYLGDHNDVHWRADLVESIRVDGKPRQRHIAYLCGFTEQQFKDQHTGKVREAQQLYVWEHALDCLDRLHNRITNEDRERIETVLAARIGTPKPTREAIEAQHAKVREILPIFRTGTAG
jgi:hypothetical protein